MKNASCAVVLIALVALSFGCQRETPEEAPETVQDEGRSEIAFQLPERDLIPEGICYDPEEDVFYLGSIRKSKILKISRDGEVEVFVQPIEGEERGYLGMRIDLNRRILWANWHQDLQPNDPDPERQLWTGISKFDLESGQLIREYLIEKTDKNHLFNDVAIARDGTVYLTSFSYGMIYTVNSVTDEIQEYLQMPEGIWNNGIDITPDDRYLFVVGNDRIFRVNVETEELFELPIPENQIIGYGDGLYFYEGNLLAITGHREEDRRVNRVVRMHLSETLDQITAIDVLDRDHPLYSNPTTGAIAGDWFYYIATAQFEKFDEEGNLAPWEELSDTYILRLRLK
jgi:hypothetical protein